MISKTKPALTYSNAFFNLTKISLTPSPIGHFTQPHAVFLLLLLQNKKGAEDGMWTPGNQRGDNTSKLQHNRDSITTRPSSTLTYEHANIYHTKATKASNKIRQRGKAHRTTACVEVSKRSPLSKTYHYTFQRLKIRGKYVRPWFKHFVKINGLQ